MAKTPDDASKLGLGGEKYLAILDAALPPKTDPNYGRWRSYALSSVERGRSCLHSLSDLVAVGGAYVLDFGCGEGGHAMAFAEAGAKVIGIDCDKRRIRRARALAEYLGVDVDFRVDRRYGEGLAGGSFDIIICNDVIEHVDSFERLAAAHSRLLRSNGALYLTVGNGRYIRHIFGDPHYGLFGLSLMGPRLGKYYVTKVRKSTLNYEVNYFPGWYELRRIYRREGIKLASLSDRHLLYRLQQGTLATPLERTMAALLPLRTFMRIHRTLLEEAWSFIGRKRLVARR